MYLKNAIFTQKKAKNIAITLILILLISILLPCTNIVSYGSQYREVTNPDNIDEAKYPGYKSLLKVIQAEHPTWTFTLLYTGLDWDTVIYNETVNHGNNLVQAKDGEWLCTSSSCLNSDGSPKVYEGSNWYCASTKAVSYYMDPRNFLYSNKLFQFERLSYTDGIYTVEGIEKILAGTFMANTSPQAYYGNSSYSSNSFAQIMLDAGIAKQISPYHIASRIKQEIVVSGGGPSRSVTGTVSGYEGLFNFFNIGASTGAGAIERGLEYARGKNWTTPEAAIQGGAESIAKNYIAKGQDTLYLQKFNVDSQDGSLYTHQYQANIQAPESESKKIYESYNSLGLLNSSLNFIIPVYENMPDTTCGMPGVEVNIVTENVMVNSTNINVRADKSTSSESIAKVNTGDVLLRIERGNTNINGYVWDKVVLSDGRIGYIATQFIDFTSNVVTCDTPAYLVKNASLRNGPGTTGTTIVSKLQTGQKVTIIDKGRYTINGVVWDKVKLENGTIGYVEAEYISSIQGSTEGDIVKIATSSLPLTVRSEPGTDKSIVTKLEKGTLVIRLEKNVSSANGLQWDKIKTFDGIVGYVSAEYLELVVAKLEPITGMTEISIDASSKIIKCEPNTKVSHLLEKQNGAIVKNSAGEQVTDTSSGLGTGYIATIEGIDYTIIKLGDSTGDGIINSADLLRIQKHLLQVISLDGTPNAEASDVNKDDKINSADLLKIQKYLLGVSNINL